MSKSLGNDFDDILKLASINKSHASKEIKKIDKAAEVDRKVQEKRRHQERVEMKEELKRASKPFVKPSLPISKAKKGAEVTVDSKRIASFLKKKDEEKRRSEVEKKRQKEELIKFCLESHGGKANKKLAKQFGTTPIELQQKYGNDRDHEEYLRKKQIREEEEADRLASELRGSVQKALERKKKVDKLAPTEEQRKQKGPHRMAITKENSMRYFMKEDSPGPSTKSDKKKDLKKEQKEVVNVNRKRSNSSYDFARLMQTAEAIQKGDPAAQQSCAPPRANHPPPVPPYKKKKIDSDVKATVPTPGFSADRKQSFTSSPFSKGDPSRGVSSGVTSSNTAKKLDGAYRKDFNGSRDSCPSGSQKHFNASRDERPSGSQKDQRNAFSHKESTKDSLPVQSSRPGNREPPIRGKPVSGSANNTSKPDSYSGKDSSSSKSRPSMPPPTSSNPQKKYLPGDIRYQGPPVPVKSDSNAPGRSQSKPGNTSRSAAPPIRDPPNKNPQWKDKKASNGAIEKANVNRGPPVRRPDDDYVQRVREQLSRGYEMEQKNRWLPPRRGDDDLSDDDEDESNSEDDRGSLDDFIDDTEIDDFNRQDLEETLKVVNRRYNKQKWARNERLIDDRRMEANFRDISKEEFRSSRIGLLEDIREAQAGGSVAL